LHWDETRQRWIATATLGFDGRGKRITRKASGKTNTEAKARLREILREHEDGVTRTAQRYSVEDAVRYWLTYGLAGVGPITVRNYTNIAERHVIPKLGARQLAKLAAQDVDGWLRERSLVLSTRTLRLAHSILNRWSSTRWREITSAATSWNCARSPLAGGPQVQVAHAGPGRQGAHRGRKFRLARLRGAVAVDPCPH